MRDRTKVELFDELLACAIQSSHAMGVTVRALSSDPIHASQVTLLNESLDELDSNKVLLSKVFHPPSNIRFPLLFIAKEIQEKKSFLGPLRKRCDRFTLVPIEALLTSLPLFTISLKRILPRRDLVAASSACRSWRPVAQLILHDRVNIYTECV
jgi:hypothetical protein